MNAEEQDCRVEFENYAKRKFILSRNDETTGKYSWSDTEIAWLAWQAAWYTRKGEAK